MPDLRRYDRVQHYTSQRWGYIERLQTDKALVVWDSGGKSWVRTSTLWSPQAEGRVSGETSM
ncbi:MAG: hypothetical protein K6T83_20440 [Alicyclobacillus sp.]|nr:hypothetical protein [Alicyclobacillus sp.]